MNETWIIQSKLTPPSRPNGWLARELVGAGDRLPATTLLVAGPGYGKTLGLLALVGPALERLAPVLWYTLDSYDADPATFFYYLVAAVQAHVPQFGPEVTALLQGEKLEPRLLWTRFFQAIASYNLPEVYLVLDDFHHLQEQQPELVNALAYFFDKLPPRLHLLIASRRKLTVPLSKARSQGVVQLLSEDKLRFSSEEEVAFMQARAPEGQIPNHWWRQATGLDGWPLGLELATTVASERELRLDPRTGGVEGLTGYVAEELYGAQDPARRAFMLEASLLAEPSAEACRAVFDRPDAAEQLDELEALHLVRRLAGGLDYRFSSYLRDFLLGEAERTVPGARLDELRRRAGAFYGARGHFEQGLPYWVAARDWAAASLACEQAFPVMRFVGRQAQIVRWLDSFPPEVAREAPVLQLWQGHQLSRSGQTLEALPAYERAKTLYAEREDAQGVFKVMVRQCTVCLIHQDQRQAGLALLEALARQPAGKNEDLVDLYLARALAAEQGGDLAVMESCNVAVLQIPTEQNIEIAASQTIALMNLFTLDMHRGALASAHGYIARALELADAWGFYPYKLFAGFLQAHLRILEGDTEPANLFLRGLDPHWRDLLDWHDLACAYTTLGFGHQARGEWKEAEDAFTRSSATFEQAGFDEGKKVALERLLWLAVQRRQAGRGIELMAPVGTEQQNIYDLALLTPSGRCLQLQGESEQALAVYIRAIAGLEAAGAELHLARALLYSGATRLKLGDEAGAREAVSRALALAEARHYTFLPAQDPLLWEELLPLVARHRLAIAFVEQALSAAARHEVVLAAPAPVDAGSPAAAASAPATGRLSVRCFGGFEVRIDGVLLDQWPRRKAKLILAALMLYPRGMGLAQLAEVLGGHDPVTAGTVTTLKVDVSALRKTLEPAMPKGGSSRYVLTQLERYSVDFEAVEYLDLRLFEVAMIQGDRLRDSDEPAACELYEQALASYRGNLLDDAFFQKYFEAEREQYRQQVVAALLWLSGFHQRRGALSQAEAALVRAVELAPCEEEAYIALMRFQQQAGRRDRIRQVYWDCRKALKAHLGLTPSPEFEEAYQGIAKSA